MTLASSIRAAASTKPSLACRAKTDVRILTDDDVIEYLHTNHRAHQGEARRRLNVDRAGFGITRRVIMREDDGGGVDGERGLEHVGWLNRHTSDTAAAHLVPADDPPPRRQTQNAEDFDRFVFEYRRKQGADVIGP